MKNKIFKPLFVALLTFAVLAGCEALEDKEVQPPIPWETEKNTALDINTRSTFMGNYKPSKITLSPLPNAPEVTYLNAVINIFPNNETNALDYNYAVQKQGYSTTGDFIKNIPFAKLSDVEILSDKYTINIAFPIEIQDGTTTYYIHQLKKINDNMINFTEETVAADIIKEYKVCDPTIKNTTDDNSCASINGAVKYIGYYRVEQITCNNDIYIGGQDFAGEMVAAPTLVGEDPQNPLDVSIPITLKIQVSNNSNLKDCLLTTEEQNTGNIYYSNDKFLLTNKDYSGNEGLLGAFSKVGLIGLTTDNEEERTTQIDYAPKQNQKVENSDGSTYFPEKTFGNTGNNATMRLKFMQSSTLNQLPVIVIDNSPYFKE